MQQIKNFLQGKKTYMSAALVALVAIVGYWYGVLDETKALALLGVAGGMAGLGAKNQRTADTILTVLAELRSVQAKSAAGQKVDAKQLAVDLGKEVLSNFATGGLVRSTPAGAVSNVVFNGGVLKCIYCDQPIDSNGGVCTGPSNNSARGSDGFVHHVFLGPVTNGAPTK